MKPELMKILGCPQCKNPLELEALREDGAEIIDGILSCKPCGLNYLVVDGIPRLLSMDFLAGAKSIEAFGERHSSRLQSLDIRLTASEQSDRKLELIKSKTLKYFGYEWDRFKNWGWIPDEEIPPEERWKYVGGLVSSTVGAFESKVMMTEAELARGGWVLDAGCGNGRFTDQAARFGAMTVGMDIGTLTVEAAYKNCLSKPNIHIVQGDLHHVPFQNRVFDTIFSNGVLMHTGDAYKAFASIVEALKPEGVLTIHVYQRLNMIWEIDDYLLRAVTTRLSIPANIKFAYFMTRLARMLSRIHPRLLHFANLFIRLQMTLHHMYDWYSAPIATHHTYDEVEGWCRKHGVQVLLTDRPDRRRIWRYPWGMTVKGRKLPAAVYN